MTGRSAKDGGQALVETALLLPVLLGLALLVAVGAEFLQTEIGLTNAARAAAVAAAGAARRGAPVLAVAQQAAAAEGTTLSCSGSGVPSGCVAVTAVKGVQSGIALERAEVYDTLLPWWPVGGGVTLRAQAAAAV